MRVVFDASVLVFALVERREAAIEWFRRFARRELDVSVPDLVFAEAGQALAGHVRASRMSAAQAAERMDVLLDAPFDVRSLASLAAPALALALDRGLSVYDACYAVLAEAEDVVLVTGDRRLAAATTRAEVV